jgi:hypothetical protein
LNPKDVSFSNLYFQEDTCPTVATGFYSSWQPLYPHPQGSWVSIGSGDRTKGCRVLGDDQVWSGAKPGPYSVGSFTWNIPCNYKANDGVSHEFTTSAQNWVSDEAGKCTIQKNGTGPVSKNANDPTSSWYQ